MRQPTATTLLLATVLAAAPACGRKGPLTLPPGGAPAAVTGLAAAVRDGAADLTWTNPAKTVSGRPLGRLAAVEIWVFERDLPAAGAALADGEVAKAARLLRRIAARDFGAFRGREGMGPGAMAFPFVPDPARTGPARLAFTVRVVDARGRASAFAPPVRVELGPGRPRVDRTAPEGVSWGGGARP